MSVTIHLEHCSVRYTAAAPWALSELSMSIPQGSCCAILGPTSAGKSTLLQTLSGYLGKHHRSALSLGTFQIGGVQYDGLPREILFPLVGLVMQDPFVMISGIHETVYQEVAFTLSNIQREPAAVSAQVEKTLASLKLSSLAQRPPPMLSGGEAQRVALASILVADPKILLLDEPRNALDCEGQENLARILQSLRGKTTVLFSDYQIELALAVADYVLVLNEGTSLFFGSRKDFLRERGRYKQILFSSEWTEVVDSSLLSSDQRFRHRFHKLGWL